MALTPASLGLLTTVFVTFVLNMEVHYAEKEGPSALV